MIEYKIDLDPLKKEFARLADKSVLNKAVLKGLAKVALELRGDVIPRTPRGLGQLVNSWRVEKGFDNDLEVGFDIIYAAYQERGKREDGTYVIKNRPAGGETGFMTKTIDENLQKYLDIFEKVVFTELFKNF